MMNVSILMAVYNSEKWLQKAIDSVLTQSYEDWELICMDDGSMDSSLQILQRNAAQDDRIRVYSYSHCGSHAVYLNRGAKLAKGEFLFPLDSDDWISSDLLSQLLQRQYATNADFVIPDMCRIDEEGKELSCIKGCLGDRDIVISGRQAVIYSLDWSIHTLGLMRKVIALAHPYEEDGYCVEVTSRQRLLACKEVAFSNGVYYYLQNTQSITKRLGVRKFYYVVIDMKILQFLHQNGFDSEIESSYYVASLRRLIATQILYYQRGKELSFNDRMCVKSYLDTSYHYAISRTDLWSSIKNLLSPKQSITLRTRKQWIFKVYCYLRK